ncbi:MULTISPECIES: tripartite tricarboxylate transporter permease [Rothia]|uniref:tripartite tricarboxylate transporter permease n=1 Tax=Rothia TaxID=32207 RepID=UPI001EEFB382|nr:MULTISPECIES: tripartite tricarboxylate transporter permease [Rothia]
MNPLDGLATGFAVAFDPINLLFVLIGVVVGTLIGLIPGLGPVTAIALLLPITYELEASTSIMMLAGIYYGSMYGGRIPAILLRLPGDASAVVTTFDGYPLAKKGKASEAMSLTAIGSFIGGTIAIIGLSFLAPLLANVTGQISSADLFALALVGLLMIVVLAGGSKAKALIMGALGIIIATVGLDPINGADRLTFGSMELLTGFDIVAVAVGLFGIGELLYNAEHGFFKGMGSSDLRPKMPSRADWLISRLAILRASIIGFFIGIIPGGGGTVSSVVAYGVEKKISKHPERFGKGAMEGLAATETADNASSNSSFIPLLTLGVPPNPVLALIFGALMLQNITPGPTLINDHPDVFWGVIASMYIGNLLLLGLNLPLVGVFAQMLRIRGSIMAPIILLVALCGVYSVRNSLFDVFSAIFFGFVGYALRKANFELGPLILGFILGPILEVQFRRAMLVSGGDFGIFLASPMVLGILMVLLCIAVYTVVSRLRARQKELRKLANDPDHTMYIG